MNQQDRLMVQRFEDKLDGVWKEVYKQGKGQVRIESKIDSHLQEHKKRVKYGIAVVGSIISLFVGGVLWVLNKIGGKG